MHILYDRPDFTILHDPGPGWLHVLWRGVHPGLTARNRCEKILECVRLVKSPKILNDGSQDLDGWEAIVDWARDEFFQQLADSGVVAIAWVIPEDIRAQTHMRQTLPTIQCLTIDTFVDAEEAYAWLCQFPSTNQAGC